MDLKKEESIQMKIAKTAARNWGQQEPTNLEESLSITCDSEVATVKGIIETLGLDGNFEEKLIGTKDDEGKLLRNGEIYTRASISDDIASKIGTDLTNKKIINILSTIHNAWVKNNKNNFMKVNDNGERRNKERQFVPLELLDWGEVQSDLLFLKPILEGAGIKIDEEQLKQEFYLKQQNYIIENQIFSHQDLVNYLSKGHENYPALEGLETKFGGSIDELLKNSQIQEEMATQIESRVEIKSRENSKKEIENYVKGKIKEKKFDNPIVIQHIKEELLNGSQELCLVNKLGREAKGVLMTKAMSDIGFKYGAGFLKCVETFIQYEGLQHTYYASCNEEKYLRRVPFFRKAMKERIKKLNAYKKAISLDENGKYDKEGEITISMYNEVDGVSEFNYEYVADFSYYTIGNLHIPVTMKELINAGILPEDYNWQEKAKEQEDNAQKGIGKEEVTAIAKRQKASKFKAFMQNIKMALSKNKKPDKKIER